MWLCVSVCECRNFPEEQGRGGAAQTLAVASSWEEGRGVEGWGAGREVHGDIDILLCDVSHVLCQRLP